MSFKSRSAAEQGLAKGTNIASVGSVQVSWYTGQLSSSTNGGSAAPVAHHDAVTEDSSTQAAVIPDSPEINGDAQMEDEVDSGGWGGDDFGMM